MVKKLVLGSVVGGLIVFGWGAVSWMMLPWHAAALHAFTNEAAVGTAIRANAPKPGVYFMPSHHGGGGTKPAKGPSMFAVIRLTSVDPADSAYYLRGLLTEVVGAGFMSLLLLSLPGLGYGARVRTVVLVALVAGALTRLPDWNWWGFSTGFTLLAFLDLAIGWFLAGLVIATLVHPD